MRAVRPLTTVPGGRPGSQTPRQASTRPNQNPFTPPIPLPTTDVANLAACVAALKACVESLIGQRGDASNRAVTFNDLVAFGILDASAVQSPHGSAPPSGGGAVSSVAGKTGDVTLVHTDITDFDDSIGLL